MKVSVGMSKSNGFKGQIVYIKGHKKSEEQANASLKSFQKYKGWDLQLVEGLTPKTVDSDVDIIENSRLHDFKRENYNRFLTKVSCANNHIKFFKKVIEEDEPMAFLEHDAVCISDWEQYDFKDYLILNAEFVFKAPNKLGLQQFKDYTWPSFGVCNMPENYPLSYHKDNAWKGSMMAPGTGAYAISPSGAKKMLHNIETHGLDQSDFMINSKNVHMQYVIPSPVKFASVNLSTSYGI